MGSSYTSLPSIRWRKICGILLVTAGVLFGVVPNASAAGSSVQLLPAAKLPKGLHTVAKSSHILTLADITVIADDLTVSTFHGDGLIAAFEQRLEGSVAGNRTLIDTFVFSSPNGAGDARGIWTWETSGDRIQLDKVPKSVQAFQHKVSAPGVPGWEVEVIFRKGRALLDVDTRYPGLGPNAMRGAQSLARQTTQAYAAWLDLHPA